jgi:cobalt-zinc-cadmium efflux system outer membrane protein
MFGMALAVPPLAAGTAAVPAPSNAATQAITLTQAFDMAWQRLPVARALPSRTAQARAQSQLADAWTPAPAKLSLGALSDRLYNNTGWREWEAEVSVPLWLPGQRDARQALSTAQQQVLDTQTVAHRMELAGAVREAWWRLAAAANAKAQAQGRLIWAQALLADVERRWKAGELARTDANIARTEVQMAEAEAIEAARVETQVQRSWSLLTGVLPPTVLHEETQAMANAAPKSNPRLLALDSLAMSLRARVRLLDKSQREAPELSLRAFREQSSSNEPVGNAVGIKLSIPLSSAPRVASEGAEIGAELAEAEAQAQQLREQLRFDLDGARQDLDIAQRRLVLADARSALASDTLQLMQRSFALGETDLATLLRARSAAFDAQAERDRQRIARASAISQLNQALGVLP